MKKFLLILMTLCLATCIFVGCEADNNGPETVYTTTWVSNSLTDLIPKPENGDVYYVIDDQENNAYTIGFNNLTIGDCTAYINTLSIYGFMKDDYIVNNTSSSAYMTSGNVCVNVNYEDSIMEITVSVPKSASIG